MVNQIDNDISSKCSCLEEPIQEIAASESCASVEEELLLDMSASHNHSESTPDVLCIDDYLAGSINLDIPKIAITKILVDREIIPGTDIYSVEPELRKLCKADLFVWACMGVSRKGSVSEKDNGWEHSDGGFNLTEKDKKLLLDEANAIYEEAGENTIGKTRVTITSHGIMRASRTLGGCCKKRIYK